MRVLNIHTFVIVLFMFVGCQPQTDISFLPFQSFDEFGMTEVVTDSVLEPYLLIQRTKDTIKIVRSDQKTDTMVYLNKGKYWYSSIRINYNYTLLGKLKILLSPPTWDTDYMQIDVYRYITENSVVEAYFHCGGECNIHEMGMWPDYINIFNRNFSRSYEFFDNLDNVLDSTILSNTTIWKVYQSRHELNKDSSCFDYTLYDYVAPKNTMYIKSIGRNRNITIDDSIQLNTLGTYHVPTYDFTTEDGTYTIGITGEKMHTSIKCTTLKTDKNFGLNQCGNFNHQ